MSIFNKKPGGRIHWRNGLFIALFLVLMGVLGYLALEFHTQWDFSQNNRNSLSRASIDVLQKFDGPVHVTVYATQQDLQLGDIRGIISNFIGVYQRIKSDLTLDFIDPVEQPQQAQNAGIRLNGEIVIRFKDRTERLAAINEQAFSNALVRLARTEKKQLLGLSGHGERKMDGITQRDLGNFSKKLRETGFESISFSFIDQPEIPDTGVLVIASPQIELLEGEVKKILDYLARGGNLLWLVDIGSLNGLLPLAEKLGIVFTPGVIVDPQANRLRVPTAFALATLYGTHAVTENFDYITVFPFARQLIPGENADWRSVILAEVAPQGWVETSPLEGEISFDAENDVSGPVSVAVALSRLVEDREQRVIVVGSGHFLANGYLGNGGNLDLGMNMINWLAGDEAFIPIQPRVTLDNRLELSELQLTLIATSFLITLPLIFLASGIFIRWYRRRR
ncbi:ABC transporter [Nitrosomonas sp. HPC101]|uniref:GldG family protein n=1 Tax=Nitrosomonas sp. HPC101 TaxID=1658667 RepID=UPI00136CB904|nr:GldG family protein [Nitrosomonas sp. HPC101]MXS86296.1 ABC transporter [Nitrosomonas sp. HPC101]